MAELEDVQGREAAGVSRRLLLAGGVGAVAGGTAMVAGMHSGDASALGVPKLDMPHPETLAAMVSQCTYLPLDATAFFTRDPLMRVIDDVVGVNANNGGLWIEASLPIMAGAVIRQIQISYRGSPTFSLVSRAMEGPTPIGQLLTTSLDAGPGNKTQTIDLDGSPGRGTVFLNTRTTYSLRFVIPNPKTDSIFGVSIGHVPPTQLYVPNLSSPRVFDTRTASTGGPTKLAAGEERIVDMLYPGPRSAVFNLTLAETEGTGGYVAAFAADQVWPGNSSINWSSVGQIVANMVICPMDAFGRIKIRGGSNSTHVIIDRIGFYL
ncbi:MAG: hypothetical protein JWN62_2353 [Acidimicrobiales bacterium]|nr:hypothetical protein [Acidimicrobiales bacterium]